MKRVLPLVLVVGGVGLVLWVVVRSSGQRRPLSRPAVTATATPPVEAAQPKATPPATATPPASSDTEAEKVVYQFSDEAGMREFAGLWQQRQKALLRLAVARAYFDNEQEAAAKLNTQLETQYSLNPKSNYTLDAQKRQLIEHPAPAEAPGTPPAEGQPAAPSAGEEKVVHTFTDEAEMKTFADLWQQHQGSGVRMAVLKSFWDEDNAALTKLNEAFTATYKLDTTKNYRFDAQRRVIVEAPHLPPGVGGTPPAPGEPATPPGPPVTGAGASQPSSP